MTVKEFKDYQKNLYSALSRDLEAFEKNFLLLAGGILAFSITFIKDIVKIGSAELLVLLYISWALFILAIALMMFTFIRSVSYSNKLLGLVTEFTDEHRYYNETDTVDPQALHTLRTDKIGPLYSRGKQALNALRYIAVASFILGITGFGYFVSYNLSRENRKPVKTEAPKALTLTKGDTLIVK